MRVIDKPASSNPSWSGAVPDPGSSSAPWCVHNIGNSEPVELLRYIQAIEDALGMKARYELLPLQPGDVPDTHADVRALKNDFGYRPSTPIDVGVKNFVSWYLDYYKN